MHACSSNPQRTNDTATAEQENRQAYPYTNSYIKKCNPFPPPPTTNLHVEKIPSLKTSFPTRPSTSPQLPSHSPSQYPGTNRSRETKPGPALPSPARLRKTEEKRKVNAMLKPHPSFLSHTRTDKMLKRQTRKKKSKKESLWSFLPSHSLREKRTK